jgi:hypothetical protein
MIAEYPANLSIEQLALADLCKIAAHCSAEATKANGKAIGSVDNINDATKADTDSLHFRNLQQSVCLSIAEKCTTIVGLIDKGEVAMALGTLAPAKDAVSTSGNSAASAEKTEKRKKAETDKVALVEAYSAMCHAYLFCMQNCDRNGGTASTADEGGQDAATKDGANTKKAEYKASFESAVEDLQLWDALSEDRHWYLRTVQYLIQAPIPKLGLALKCVQDCLAKVEKGESIAIDANVQSIQGTGTRDTLLQLRQEILVKSEETGEGLNWTHLGSRAAASNIVLAAPTPQDK